MWRHLYLYITEFMRIDDRVSMSNEDNQTQGTHTQSDPNKTVTKNPSNEDDRTEIVLM